jgi:hypothetical protein
VIGIIFAMGCRSPFGSALAWEAKANLHPLVFYTINVTSPLIQCKMSLKGEVRFQHKMSLERMAC